MLKEKLKSGMQARRAEMRKEREEVEGFDNEEGFEEEEAELTDQSDTDGEPEEEMEEEELLDEEDILDEEGEMEEEEEKVGLWLIEAWTRWPLICNDIFKYIFLKNYAICIKFHGSGW